MEEVEAVEAGWRRRGEAGRCAGRGSGRCRGRALGQGKFASRVLSCMGRAHAAAATSCIMLGMRRLRHCSLMHFSPPSSPLPAPTLPARHSTSYLRPLYIPSFLIGSRIFNRRSHVFYRLSSRQRAIYTTKCPSMLTNFTSCTFCTIFSRCQRAPNSSPWNIPLQLKNFSFLNRFYRFQKSCFHCSVNSSPKSSLLKLPKLPESAHFCFTPYNPKSKHY